MQPSESKGSVATREPELLPGTAVDDYELAVN